VKKTYSFNDVHILPKPTELSSRAEPHLEVSYMTKYSRKSFSGLPIIVSNMDYVGTIKMAKALSPYNIYVALHKFCDIKEIQRYNGSNIFMSFGINESDKEKMLEAKALRLTFPICLDVANGYMYKFLDHIKWARDLFPDSIIMAGNVCTAEGAENIIRAGADIVKAGIGNGSFCLTNKVTGVGVPQFTVAQECGQAANELNALCCSDGSIKTPGDIAKALGAGSHLVMAGSLFAGYDENDTEWIWPVGGKRHMHFYGMSSYTANDKYFGGLQPHRTSEGHEDIIEYKGPIKTLIQDITGGLASCCTYTNTKYIENLKKNCEFVN
jgi:GMP reductase